MHTRVGACDSLPRFAAIGIEHHADVFVPWRLPQPFDKDVVHPTPALVMEIRMPAAADAPVKGRALLVMVASSAICVARSILRAFAVRVCALRTGHRGP